MKSILVTGGAGFIGSNFIHFILKKYDDIKVVNLDALTYAGNLTNLSDIESDPRYSFVRGSICDKSVLSELFDSFKFDTVVNFAAESHVDRSIVNPELFLSTNILGTQAMLNAAMRAWKLEPDNKYSYEFKDNVRFLQVSTDEVYGALGKTGKFQEDTPLAPNSPYSASKAGADLLVKSYFKTYGLPVLITRCSNNYGPYQFPEKFIPLIINNCINEAKIPLYGDGEQVRDWLYVEDHCRAIDTVLNKGRVGDVYNIGGNNEKTNISLAKCIINLLGKSEELITFVKDRPGHDQRYAIDNNKIKNELNWSPVYTFDKGIELTVKWYLENSKWLNNVTSGAYSKYYNSMYLS